MKKLLYLPKAENILIALGAILIFFTFPHGIGGDAVERFNALQSLFEQNSISNTKYSMIGPLFSSPLYLLGWWVKSPGFWVARFNPVIFLLFLFFLKKTLKDLVEERVLRKFLLLLIVGSMFPKHLKEYYAEVFTAVLVAWGLLQISIRKQSFSSVLLLCLGTANTPAMAMGTTTAVLTKVVHSKKMRYLLILLPCFGLVLIENLIRRGGILQSGYDTDVMVKTILPYSGVAGFTFPFFFGLLSHVFSFGKGILWFAPALFLPLPKEKTSQEVWKAYLLWIACMAGLILVYSKWSAWYGGWFWGPRFFLFASIPASLSLAYHLVFPSKNVPFNLLKLAILVLSVWVGLNGVVFDQHGLSVCDFEREMLCWYVPEFSALWNPFVSKQQIHSHQWVIISYFCAAAFVLISDFLKRSNLLKIAADFLKKLPAKILDFHW